MSNPFRTIKSTKLSEKDESVINDALKDLFGVDTVTGMQMFRIVWSDDQMEKRHGTFDDFIPGTQIYLRTVTETREVPKYRQWIHQKYVLERLVVVPEINKEELPDSNLSYEPLWVFQDGNENYLPPTIQAAKFIIDTVLSAQAVHKMMIDGTEKVDRPVARYVDPDNSQEAVIENQRKRIDNIVEELYGDETGLMGQTLSRNQGGGQAIIVPRNYKE